LRRNLEVIERRKEGGMRRKERSSISEASAELNHLITSEPT